MTEIPCDYCKCANLAKYTVEYIQGFSFSLCEEHQYCFENNPTGYCNYNCMLNYGCDGSC